MKRLLAAILTATMIAGLGACGSAPEETASSAGTEASQSSTEASGDAIQIGITQYMEHVALDNAREGFIDGLAEAGYVDGENIVLDIQNAQGEQANCETIATKFANDEKDLVLAIATPAAQAMANKTSEIPILITAVTDAADAGLVADNDAPGGNVSGTSDLTPVKEQMELLKELVPDVKKVAIFYSSDEDNSVFQAEIAKQEAENLGMEYEEYTISNSNEIQSVMESFMDKVDAIYIPTDNKLAAGMPLVGKLANEKQLPVICGESGMVSQGGLATYGIDYYNLGKMTAAQAVQILEGKAETATMPIETLPADKCERIINEETAAAIGLEISAAE